MRLATLLQGESTAERQYDRLFAAGDEMGAEPVDDVTLCERVAARTFCLNLARRDSAGAR